MAEDGRSAPCRRAGEDADDELARLQSAPRSSRPTRASICGLIAEQDDVGALDGARVRRRPSGSPCCRSRASRRSARGCVATIWSGATRLPRSRPAMIASAITPEPTVAILRSASDDMGGEYAMPRRRSAGQVRVEAPSQRGFAASTAARAGRPIGEPGRVDACSWPIRPGPGPRGRSRSPGTPARRRRSRCTRSGR